MNEPGSSKPDWIAVDWGTSHLRVTAVDRNGVVMAHRQSDQGMSKLQRDGFEAALLTLISDWLSDGYTTPVICCGMVGSRQGWVETAYRTAPCRPIGLTAGKPAPARDPRIDVTVIPGIRQDHPADVMRGEETQIAGLLAERPDFDGTICLPGTHSKWVHISAGEVVSFQTFLTGELFALLASQSVLKHSVASAGWDENSFRDALNDAISQPKMFAARLFSIRAEHLIGDLSPEIARSRLSGLLIGLELSAARPYWLGQDVVIIGASDLAHAYDQALRTQGLSPRVYDAEKLTIAGLAVAGSQTSKTKVGA